MKVKIYAATVALLAGVSNAAQAAVVTFAGSSGDRNVSGRLTYDPATPEDDSLSTDGSNYSYYYPGTLSFMSGDLQRSGSVFLVVADAFAGNPYAYNDGVSAFVTASSREGYGLSFDFGTTAALSSSAIPSVFPKGDASFYYYYYADEEFTIPVTFSSAVPETSTWAMMILGIGAIGCAIRRRRTSARITFA